MANQGKRYKENTTRVDRSKRYNFDEAIELAVACGTAKFDETVDVAVRLGVDPRHADQMVRGTVVLPNGIGKDVRVAVFAKGEKGKEALDAGADAVGAAPRAPVSPGAALAQPVLPGPFPFFREADRSSCPGSEGLP